MLRFVLVLLLLAFPALAEERLRFAVYTTELGRAGPGLLYRDILKGGPEIDTAVSRIIAARADVLLLCGIDWDHDLLALRALADRVAAAGLSYPHLFALRPNTGMATGLDLDLDGDGRLGGPGDAQGFGSFSGQEGMALISRLPLIAGEVVDHSGLLWRDLPGGLSPLALPAAAVQRLSTTGHWVVPLEMPGGDRITVLPWCAGPPVFGIGDVNRRRNHDETALWGAVLDGAFGPPPQPPFVLLGDANLDPERGDGNHAAIRRLLADPRLRDPHPVWPGAPPAERFATVDWTTLRSGAPGPGRLRVDYVLPSGDLKVLGAAVLPPAGGDRHGIVTVDVALPPRRDAAAQTAAGPP